jgi:hypothetical protein
VSRGSPSRFRVTIDGAPADQLRAFGAAAKAAGRLSAFSAVMREIDYRLKYEADEWGESRDDLPVMKLQVRFGTVGPVSVWYSVHTEAREVFVREFRFRGDPQEG